MGNKGFADKPLIGITLDKDGEYLRLKHQYPPAILRAGGISILIPHCNDPVIIADTIDGLLIPGGGDIDPSYYSEEAVFMKGEGGSSGNKEGCERDAAVLTSEVQLHMVPKERTEFEISLLRAIMKFRKPVFGICYGMQLINVAFGGSLYQDIACQFTTTIDHKKGSHRILGKGETIQGEFTVNSSHHQAVKGLGEGLSASALSEDGIVEAITLDDYPFLTGVQWHPERSEDELSLMLFSAFVESAHARK
jgi:putative glutamine amidotransferase